MCEHRFYTLMAKTTSAVTAAHDKLVALLEIVILVFVTTFIPSLIKLGRPPVSIDEVWVELLVAILASVYAWIRVRGISISGE